MSHTYYYCLRPPGTSCQPDGFDPDTRESWIPMKYVNGVPYLGKVSYPEPLPHEALYHFDLRPVDQVEYAEHVFWQHREPKFDLRADYLSADRAMLEEHAPRDILAQAALIILDAQENEKSTENLTGLTYVDPAGRTITVLRIDPLLGPGHYLVERDDGARWGVSAERVRDIFWDVGGINVSTQANQGSG